MYVYNISFKICCSKITRLIHCNIDYVFVVLLFASNEKNQRNDLLFCWDKAGLYLVTKYRPEM